MVLVKLFAHVRDRAGCAEVQLEPPPGAVVRDVVALLAERIPAIASLLEVSRLAVNRAFAEAFEA